MKRVFSRGLIFLFLIFSCVLLVFQENTTAQGQSQDYPSFTKKIRGSYYTMCPYQPDNGICIVSSGGQQ